MKNETIRSTVEAWLTTIGAEGVSKATIAAYSHVQVFLKGLRGDEITAFTLRRFFQEYREGRSPHSVRSVYATVHAFLRFAVAEGMVDVGLLTAMKRPKAPQSEKAVYRQGQMATLFHALAANRSPLGLRAGFGYAYVVTKHAIIGLTKQCASNGAHTVRVNCICPGGVEAAFYDETEGAKVFLDWTVANTPLGRLARPEEIAQGALFLASDESSCMTGALLVLDGGQTAK